jgi:hypothetical protein
MMALSGYFVSAQEMGKTTDKAGRVVPGVYTIASDGKYSPMTNTSEMWPGVWKESTNGLRVQLYLQDTNTPNPVLSIGVGSVITNANPGLVWHPEGKYAAFELRDSRGVLISPIKGISKQGACDFRISAKILPTWPDGGLRNIIGFSTNTPPAILEKCRLKDLYRIKKEDNYTLTVCPVIYKFETNGLYLDRIDLPSISVTLHLVAEPEP